MLFRFQIFGAPGGRGVLSRIKALLDQHSTALDNVEGEDGIGVRKNWRGGVTIYGQGLARTAAFNVSLYMAWAGYAEDESLYAKVTSGNWVHGYSSVQASDTVESDGYIHVALNAALLTQYVYVQRGADLSVSLGTSEEYPVSSTTYLRRAIGKIELTGSPDPVTGRYSVAYVGLNFGDVYTW